MTTMNKMVAKKAPKKYNNGGPVTTTKETTKKPTKVVKKDKTVSQAIGDITLRDVKNAGESALQISTLGAYGKIKEALGGNKFKFKKAGEKKYGGKMSKAKTGTSVKKARDGETMIGNAGAMRKTKMKERSPDGNYVVKRVTRTTPDGEKTTQKIRRSVQGFLKGAPKVSTNKALKDVPNRFFSSPDEMYKNGGSTKKAKSGGSMKKCRYGCK